jgi:hypothetical protein
MKYRKRPYDVHAWCALDLIRAAKHDWGQMPALVSAAYDEGNVLFTPSTVQVKTNHGWMEATNYDMVISGIDGELYPCKRDVFERLYESAE